MLKTEEQDAVKALVKLASVEFFYWWHNQSGSNTAHAFDLWWETVSSHPIYVSAATAIREEERRRAAEIAEREATKLRINETGYYAGWNDACERIATTIRTEGE